MLVAYTVMGLWDCYGIDNIEIYYQNGFRKLHKVTVNLFEIDNQHCKVLLSR